MILPPPNCQNALTCVITVCPSFFSKAPLALLTLDVGASAFAERTSLLALASMCGSV